MKNIFVTLILSSILFSCKKENEGDGINPALQETKPGLHFSGSSRDTSYAVDFVTDIYGKLDTARQDQSGRMVYTISASQKESPFYFFSIRLLTDSTGNIPEGEYYLTPDMINDSVFDYTTTKGVGRFEYRTQVHGSYGSWTGTEWTDRTDWAKTLITKNEDDYLSGEFSGRFTRTEVVYGDMKLTFNGYFNNIKKEYHQ